MPHINRIRLVNVNFNDAKNIYDDFTMKLDGKSTTYDLKNTGGKSLLLLMLLQTVIPNTYLKKEKPVKNIFAGGNPKRTSHCLVEWVLDEGYQYKYMLTGFCARKKQDTDDDTESEDKLEIDYYNYCYFYNSDNKNDIKHIQLVTKENGEKSYMSYDKLRQLLLSMKKDELPVKIFDSKKEYMKYIAYYGLIPAEWRLISAINVSENYIEKYFKENKTSRKLIENFLIKIIDDVNMQNNDEEENENQLADTLIELKDNLMQFRKQSDNRNEFLQAKELYMKLEEKNNSLVNEFSNAEKINKKANEAFSYKTQEKERLASNIKQETEEISRLEEENTTLEKNNNKLNIDELYYKKDKVIKEEEEINSENEKAKKQKEDLQRKIEIQKSQNEYVDYVENKSKAEQVQIKISNLSLGGEEKEKEYQKYGYNYKTLLESKIQEFEVAKENQIRIRNEKTEAQKIATQSERDARGILGQYKNKIEIVKTEISEKQEEIDTINQNMAELGKIELLLNLDESILSEKQKLENKKIEKEEATKKIEDLKQEKTKQEEKIIELKGKTETWQEKQIVAQKEDEIYEQSKKSIENLVKTFQAENMQNLKEKLKEILEQGEKQRNAKQIERQLKKRKLELIEKYNMLVPNEDIFHLKEKLESKCNYVTTGIEKLMGMQESEKAEVLQKNPLFIYTVFIDNENFEKIKNKQLEVEMENLVPIASVELLRGIYEYKEKDVIFPIQKSVYQNLKQEKLEDFKEKLGKTIDSLENEIENYRQKENRTMNYIEEIKGFILEYTEEKIKNIYKNKENIDNEINKIRENIKKAYQTIENNKEEMQKLGEKIEKQENEIQELAKEIQLLEDLKKLNADLSKLKENKEKCEKDYDAQKEIVQEKEIIISNIAEELEKAKTKIVEIEQLQNKYKENLGQLYEFEKSDILAESFDEVRNHFEALDSQMKNSHQELNDLREKYKLYTNLMNKCEKTIKENNCSIESFFEQNEHFEKISENIIQENSSKLNELERELQKKQELLQAKEAEINQIVGKIGFLKDTLEEGGEKYFEENRITDIEIIHKNWADNNLKLKLNKKAIKELKNKIETVQKEVTNLEIECKQLENYLIEKNIKIEEIDVSNILKNEVYSYKKIHEEAIKLYQTIEKQKSEFEESIRYIKGKIETFYIKQDILDAIQELKIATRLDEAENTAKGLETIIEQIDERIKHTEEALAILEKYQENFITKCFEKAETIVRDLEKLPGLSRIKIGGKNINIIKLDLFEYEKEEKMSRMKEYIYKIVKEMEENPDKMNKEELNECLSSKSLVAQIVNMDKASIKLYKIEDIQEHSTYKRWEDDLGSDGQVNAIYFMFAVCIISYISMLTRKDGSSKSKKVIIVDNPFGATSAVFLWNVMFAILKENNVQLIAPGHNINKEIISKFEVNYVLKHEFYNGNKKSVVVDKELRTEDNLENMSFETIEGEQQRMF